MKPFDPSRDWQGMPPQGTHVVIDLDDMTWSGYQRNGQEVAPSQTHGQGYSGAAFFEWIDRVGAAMWGVD